MRIAIVRLTSLGDLVCTLPLAQALRRHSHTSYIVWIVEEREQTLLLHNPVVDEVVVGPTRRWRHELRTPIGAIKVAQELRILGRRLRSLRLDVAIDPQGLLKSTIFTVLTRAPVRIGFGWHHAREPLSSLFTTHRVSPPPEAVHLVEKQLSLLQPLGIQPREVTFPLPTVPEAEEKAAAILQEHQVSPQDRLVVLIPATRRPAKQWPAANFRLLAERLAERAGVRVLLLAGPGEERLLQGIAHDLEAHLIPAPSASVPELVAFLRQAHLAVGNDTGPLHLAAVLGVPTIGLYGPTNPLWNGPYGPRVRAIRSPTEWMEDISVDLVFQTAVDWLA